MRRLLKYPPKAFRHEFLGKLTRATLNTTDKVEPFNFVPYRPHYCPVCGEDAGQSGDRLAVILAVEFEGAIQHDLPVWSHRKCFEECADTRESDVPFD